MFNRNLHYIIGGLVTIFLLAVLHVSYLAAIIGVIVGGVAGEIFDRKFRNVP
jgi:membrane associated rhomboid family serine protease